MGKTRKTNDGRHRKRAKEIIYFVHSIFKAYDLGFINLPKSIYHYERAIQKALDGNLIPLRSALDAVARRSNYISDGEFDHATLSKWKGGMAGHFTNMYYVLSMFHQLLTEYHKACNDYPLTLSAVTIKRTSLVPHKVFSREGKEFTKHYRECEPCQL